MQPAAESVHTELYVYKFFFLVVRSWSLSIFGLGCLYYIYLLGHEQAYIWAVYLDHHGTNTLLLKKR